ncbi:protein FAM234B [Sinocyclocheilus rhinocerous]|uniref:protein FAM234B n=1 Tax=Sinocyclocheilus rhinocerous TaxID=307959 RepID=UPI0007B9BAA1|nr:PREDICTED: protein FAM234B-like [Sinocyclocheilus rhinocerous]
MAASLSRALKLPGESFINSEYYDPLTQADSEDETEDDDLVLNYPCNGLSPAVADLREEEELDDEEELREGAGAGRGQGGAAEEKAAQVRGAVRTAVFLLPLSCAALLVLLCAFLIPCPQGAPQWERELGDTAGVTSPPVALWDVDGDGLEDVLIGVTNISNNSQPMNAQSKGEHIKSLQTQKRFIPAQELIRLQLVNCNNNFNDNLSVSDLALVLISGRSGALIGRPVNFNLTAQGKLIGPLLHETQTGAYYVLFGLGTVEAVSLSHIYSRATGQTAASRVRLKEPSWERLRKSISSSLIHISSGSEQVEFLLPLVAGSCQKHSNLELNCSRSDWILLCDASSRLSVLRASDTHTAWSLSLASIHTRPAAGHFNDDGVPDLLVHQSANGVRKVQIVDGARGRSLWEAEFVCPRLAVEDSSVLTASGQSVFLFWAGDPLAQPQNVTKAPAAAEPVLRKLFLLHPDYPTILLQLSSTTDTVLSATVSYQAQQKDASYISVSSRPSSGRALGAQMLKTLSLRAALADARILRLTDADRDGKLSAFHVNTFFRRLAFRQ